MKILQAIGVLILGGLIMAFIADAPWQHNDNRQPAPPPATSLPAPAVPPDANGASPWAPATTSPATVTYVTTGSPAQVAYGPAGSISTGTTPLNLSAAVPVPGPTYYVLTVQPMGGPATCQILVNGYAVSVHQAPAGGSATCEIAQNFETGVWEENLSAA